MYPGIERWVGDKVFPGLRSSERVAFVGYLDEKPVVSAVVKRGSTGKFCHLRIHEELQNAHLGDVFFALMANEVRDLAKSIYFTLPESLWESKKEFFRSFHFLERTKAANQYRLFDEELQCRASFRDVWQRVAEKLPKILELYSPSETSPADDLLFSVRPEYVNPILQGKKRIELRRKFSTKWLGHVINLYASGPVMRLVGQARVSRIVVKTPELIWLEFKDQIGCARKEFDRYTASAGEIYALELDEVTGFRVSVSRSDASLLLKEPLVPPQSYCTLEKNKAWAKAVSLAALLQGTFSCKWLSGLRSAKPRQFRTLSSQNNVLASQFRRILTK